MPVSNAACLEYIMRYLHQLIKHETVNKMNLSTTAIMFGPLIFRFPSSEIQNTKEFMMESMQTTDIISNILINIDKIFYPESIGYTIVLAPIEETATIKEKKKGFFTFGSRINKVASSPSNGMPSPASNVMTSSSLNAQSLPPEISQPLLPSLNSQTSFLVSEHPSSAVNEESLSFVNNEPLSPINDHPSSTVNERLSSVNNEALSSVKDQTLSAVNDRTSFSTDVIEELKLRYIAHGLPQLPGKIEEAELNAGIEALADMRLGAQGILNDSKVHEN